MMTVGLGFTKVILYEEQKRSADDGKANHS
jgi:hypothetical protein